MHLPPCREPSGRLNHPGSSVSPLSARGRDKDRILYGLAILLMAASMAGERKLKAAICCDMQQKKKSPAEQAGQRFYLLLSVPV